MTRELLPWGARKKWHRRWHRPVARVAGSCILVTACGILLDCHVTIERAAPGTTRRRVCGRCRMATAGPLPYVRREPERPAGQLEAFR